MTEENGLSWSRKTDLPASRHGAASAVHAGKIWVMGGSVNFHSSASVLVYDAEADTWGEGPPLPSPTDSCAAVTIEGDAGGLLCHAGNGAFLYRNAAWVGVAGEFPMSAALGAVLLG